MNYPKRQGLMAKARMKTPKKIQNKSHKKPIRAEAKSAKSQDSHLKAMANTVGDFIRYWGFRRIHGQLWTQIYLSKEPLSGADLVRSLGVSKALVSPALTELLKFNLITYTDTDGRTKKYTANPAVFEVIRTILRQREKRLIEMAQKNFEELLSFENNQHDSNTKIDHDRLKALGEMISAASFALDVVIKSSENDPLSSWSILDDSIS